MQIYNVKIKSEVKAHLLKIGLYYFPIITLNFLKITIVIDISVGKDYTNENIMTYYIVKERNIVR